MFNALDMAERIRQRRKALGLTQTDLALRAGTSTQTIARIEAGESGSVAFATMVRVLNELSYNLFIELSIPAEPQPSLSAHEIEEYLNAKYFGSTL